MEGPSMEKQRVVQIARVSLHQARPLEISLLSSPIQTDDHWTGLESFGQHQRLVGACTSNTAKVCKN